MKTNIHTLKGIVSRTHFILFELHLEPYNLIYVGNTIFLDSCYICCQADVL